MMSTLDSEPEISKQNASPELEARLLTWQPSEMEIGRTVDGVLAGLLPFIQAAARERDEAPALFAELLRHPPGRREMLARNSRRFRNFPLCELLLRKGYGDSFDDPGQGERLAALALTLVESLDAACYGEPLLADARGRCWTVIGHARRVAADLRGAEEAFRRAEGHLLQGTSLTVARRRAGRPLRLPAVRTPRR